MSKLIELLDKYSISASEEQVLDFEKWLINTTWSKYNEERMNNRIIIENQIKSLGLRFPNGTVGKEYSAKLVIPSGLVDDIWIEGLNDLGLELVPNATTLNECNNCENANVDENITAETQEHAINVSQDDVVTTEQQEAKKDEDIELLISGKPITAGDFTLVLKYKHKGWLNQEVISEIKMPIAFNPDPRSLWKNIPTSENRIQVF